SHCTSVRSISESGEKMDLCPSGFGIAIWVASLQSHPLLFIRGGFCKVASASGNHSRMSQREADIKSSRGLQAIAREWMTGGLYARIRTSCTQQVWSRHLRLKPGRAREKPLPLARFVNLQRHFSCQIEPKRKQ